MTRAQRTHAELQRHALALFLRQGYDETTVAEVAAAAGVSHMTFFRHFPTKEDVVVWDPYDPLIGEAVARQPRGLHPVVRVCDGLRAAWEALPELDEAGTRARIRLVAAHPKLRARTWDSTYETQQTIAAALRHTGVTRLDAHVAAAACLGALTAALFDWAIGDSRESLGERMARALHVVASSNSARTQARS